MADIIQEKKKTGWARRIIKWIGLGLLALLIILALIFQAPWKILALLAIILAACTVLPKQMRKWFWLGVGAVVLLLIVWIFMPEDNEGWRPYTFDKELAALEAQYAIPDEENAALAYEAIFKNLDVDSNQPEFFLKTMPSSKDEPWRSKDHPETAEWLNGHQDTIEKLIKVTAKEKCRFKAGVDPTVFNTYVKRFSNIRQLAFLSLSSANNDVAEDRNNAGIDKYLCILRMARYQYQQQLLIDHIVGYGIERLALNPLNRFVIEGEPTAKQLQHISKSLNNLTNDWNSDFERILEYEKLFAKNTLCSLAYEVNPKGRIRLSRDPTNVLKNTYPDTPSPTYRQKILNKAETVLGRLSMPDNPQKVAEMIDANIEKWFAKAETDYDWTKKSHESVLPFTGKDVKRLRFSYKSFARLTAETWEKTYYHIRDLYARTLAFRRGSRLLIAIKQYKIKHGSWPPDLDAIKSAAPAEAFIDPVTGNPLEYENHGDRFSLFGETVNVWPK